MGGTMAGNTARLSELMAYDRDISFAQYCAKTMKERRLFHVDGFIDDDVYQEHLVYLISMAVSYARPFKKSIGWGVLSPKYASYTVAQRKFHEHIIHLRDKCFAHTDSETFSATPLESSVPGVQRFRVQTLLPALSEGDLDMFYEMTTRLWFKLLDEQNATGGHISSVIEVPRGR